MSSSLGLSSGFATRPSRHRGENNNHVRDMMTRFVSDYSRRRDREDEECDPQPEVKPLKVELTEFYAKDNANLHHTEEYELVQDSPSTPVLRRGQTFHFAARFDRQYNPETDMIKLVFEFGPRPNSSKGTRVILSVTAKKDLSVDNSKWDVSVDRHDGNTITFQVLISASAQVGIWHCTFQTKIKKRRNTLKHRCSEDVYILFNPWCKEDAVYMEGEENKREYVMNATGKVWVGSVREPRGRSWIFGQFDDTVLPATMYLLELSKLKHTNRGNAIQVVRAISAVVNSNDDDGLLEGCWHGDYADGTPPWCWTGSVAILEKYLKDGGKPVKYGQCWVFSAVTVTVCRALGIPCRSVTNFVSAHDTDCSLTIDKYFNKNGEEIECGPDGECYDSVWNFHVWNDVWMARPDLPVGYGGWQIIDATPQEESDSMMQCGPASLEAVRRGEIGFRYDTPFVFAEVNADMCHFQEDDSSDWGFTRIKIDRQHVGRKILTKRADADDDTGDADQEDVTHQYKNKEGSFAERLAVFNAIRGCDRAQTFYGFPETAADDVTFNLAEIEKVSYGNTFSVTVNVQNKSNEVRTIASVLSASSVYYTGATAHRLKRGQGEFVVQPNQHETLQIRVAPFDYMEKLVDYCLIKIYAIANVKETKQTWSDEDDFALQKPRLAIEVSGERKIGGECHATFSFQNPLKVILSDCTFSIEGPGLQRPKILVFRDVNPEEMVTYTERFVPKRVGERKIVATFSSRQLSEVTGSTTVHVIA